MVDDEKLIRWSVGERLTRQGFEVQTAETGEQAVELVAAKRPAVMLLDVRLPGIDGVETLRQALAAHPELVVVMMSAHSSVDTAVEAMKDGAVDFLVKPFPLAQLDAAVERAFATVAARSQLAAPSPAEGRGMVGRSPSLQRLQALLARLEASSETTVLVVGESGSGKELVARAIHDASGSGERPFVAVNCAALPTELVESELFGHQKGSYTGATDASQGLFRAAGDGSLLLDEITEMATDTQAKLLRVLEERLVRPVGAPKELPVRCRFIASTNRQPEKAIEEGVLRRDLFHRLDVHRLEVPPLRERADDVPELIAHFAALTSARLAKEARPFTAEALALAKAYPWPGNVRELKNAVEYALTMAKGQAVKPEHLPASVQKGARAAAPPQGELPDVHQAEDELIRRALEKTRGNKLQAARLLGISRHRLYDRLKKLQLE